MTLLDKVKIAFYILLLIAVPCLTGFTLHVMYNLNRTLDTVNKMLPAVAIDLHTTFQNANDTIRQATETIAKTKEAMSEVAETARNQKEALAAENQRINSTLEQVENTLLNAQLTMAHIDENQGRLTDATIQTINNLNPVLNNAAQSIKAAGDRLNDPALVQTAKNIQDTTEHLAGTVKNVETTTGRIDAKVQQMLKPGNFIWNGIKSLLGIGANVAQIVK